MPIRYAGNDNRITYGKTPIKSIMQGEIAVYGEDLAAQWVDEVFVMDDSSSTISVTGLTEYGKTLQSIRVPSIYRGKAVTGIENTAFNNATNITSVVIPDSITSIGSGAFSGCSSLESITIPFAGAKVENTPSSTYQYPFGYIFGTSSYNGGTGVSQPRYENDSYVSTSAIYYIPSSLRSVKVLGGDITRSVFQNCSMLTSVTIEQF